MLLERGQHTGYFSVQGEHAMLEGEGKPTK